MGPACYFRTSAVCIAKYGKKSLVEPANIVPCLVLRNTPSSTSIYSFPTATAGCIGDSTKSDHSSSSSEPLTVVPRPPTSAPPQLGSQPMAVSSWAYSEPTTVAQALVSLRANGLQSQLIGKPRKPQSLLTHSVSQALPTLQKSNWFR